jgi:hypothetical protein
MSPYKAAVQYIKQPTLIVRLRDVFAERLPEPPATGNPERMRLIQPGQYMTTRLPNRLPVRVEHHRDGSWLLIIPNVAAYPLIADPMTVPKRRMVWRDGAYHLPFGMRRPVRFYILDTTGRRVRNLYAIVNPDGSFKVGSRNEICRCYKTDFMTPEQRHKRRQDKVREQHPTRAGEILDWKIDIATLMKRRPNGIFRHKWLEYVIRARWGVIHKGDLTAIESEITRATQQHIWPTKKPRGMPARFKQMFRPVPTTKARGQPKGKLPSTWHRTLGPINDARAKAKRRREELAIEPPLPQWTRGDD